VPYQGAEEGARLHAAIAVIRGSTRIQHWWSSAATAIWWDRFQVRAVWKEDGRVGHLHLRLTEEASCCLWVSRALIGLSWTTNGLFLSVSSLFV